MLSIRSLGKTFPGPTPRTVLAGVSLELAAGDYVAITGESGVGKSTLLNLVAGLDRPDAGSIRIDGVDLATLDDDALTLLRRRRIGFVFQAFHVLPYLTVGENVALPLALQRESRIEPGTRVREMLAAVGLGERTDSRPRELSGGELQRVAIARALVHRPALVLADEPTGNLDPDSAAAVLALLRDAIKTQGAAGLLVTHSQAAAQTADRTLLLTRGGVSPSGRPEGEHRSAQREGSPVTPSGRPEGEHRSAQREGSPVTPSGRPEGEHRSAQREGFPAGGPASP